MKNKISSVEMVKRYEDQLLQNYEFYKSAFELSKDPRMVLEDFKIVRFNPITMKFFETEDADAIFNKNLFDFLVDDTSGYKSLKDNGTKNIYVELKLKTCKNNIVPVSINFDGISRNGIEKSIITIRNIEQEIEDRVWLKVKNSAVKAIPKPIVITDTKGQILWTNPAFETVYGYTKEEAKKGTPRVLKSGKHPENFYKELWDTILDGKTWAGQVINKCKDGELIKDNMIISPVYGDGKNITHFIAIKNLDDEELDYVGK